MSLQFNDVTTRKGIVQIYEKEIGATFGYISGNEERLKDFTADCNLAIDDYIAIAIKGSGTWQVDDTNHQNYPIITTNLVSGQRDYTFLVDENGNSILDIYKVVVKDSTGIYKELSTVDQQSADSSDLNVDSFIDGQNKTGVPTRYDKTANGIFLDLIPNYDSENGLKVFINREGSYFTYSDTIKKPGFPGLHHKYFALKPALDYARRNNLTSLPRIENDVAILERKIEDYFSERVKDERRGISVNIENCE